LLPSIPLYPDEPLPGGLARYCRWFSLPMKRLRRDVLGVPPAGGRFTSLGPVREAAALFATTPENLLWNHTLFPYATAFTAKVDSERAIRGELGAPGNRKHPGMSRLSRVGSRRVCKQCLQDDVAQYGETYWHRSHNLPGTFFCAKHRCLLHGTTLKAASRTSDVMPAECELLDPLPAWQCPGALQLALASAALLSRLPGPGEDRSADFYLGLAVAKGLLGANREVSQPALGKLFEDCFHRDFLEAARVEFNASRAWPSHAFTPRSRKLAPLGQLMVETMLRHGNPQPGVLDHKPKGPPHPSRQQMDERFAKAGTAILEQLTSQRRRLMLAPFLKRIGAEHAWHVHKGEHPKLIALVERLRDWNSSCAKEPRGPDWKQLDGTLSAAGETELRRLESSGQRLAIRAFMEQIGAWVAWKHHNTEIPQLQAIAKRLQAWNDARNASALELKYQQNDERLSAAAAAELDRAMAAGERVTLTALIKRIGAVTAWTSHQSKCPKLTLVAERVRAYEIATRASHTIAATRPPRHI
jgi:hypothetical protein